MATLREAINIAKKEPTSERSMKLLRAIQTGKMDAVAAQEGIDISRLKNAYQAENAVKETTKSIVNTFNPANLPNNLSEIAQGAARMASVMNSPANDSEVQANDSLHAAKINDLITTGESVHAPQKGYQSPGSQFPSPFDPMASESFKGSAIGNFMEKQAPQMQEALNQEAVITPEQRLQKVADQAASSINAISSGVGNVFGGAAAQLNPFDRRTVTEKATQTIGGLNQALTGTVGLGSSPLAASPVIQKALSLPFEGAHDVLGSAVYEITGIDPKSDYGKTITDSFMNGVVLAMGAKKIQQKLGVENLSLPDAWNAVKQTAKGVTHLPADVLGTAGEIINNVKPQSSVTPYIGPGAQSINETATLGGGLNRSQVNHLYSTLRRRGINEEDAGFIANLPDEQKAQLIEYLNRGLDKLANKGGIQGSTFDIPGEEVKSFVQQLKSKKQELGKAVELSKQNLGGLRAPTDAVNTEFVHMLQKYNVTPYVDSTGKLALDFSESELSKMSAAQSMLNNIYEKVQSPTMNARDMEALTGQMDQASGLLKTSGFKSTGINTSFNKIKSAINTTLSNIDSEFGSANQNYAQFIKDYKRISDATSTKVSGGEYVIDGKKLLRRLTGNDPAKYSEAIDAVQRLSDQYGIDMPTALRDKALMADFAEKYTGTVNPGSMAGVMNAAQRKAGIIGGIAKDVTAVKDYIFPPDTIRNNTEALIRVLQDHLENSGGIPTPKVEGSVPTPKVKRSVPTPKTEDSVQTSKADNIIRKAKSFSDLDSKDFQDFQKFWNHKDTQKVLKNVYGDDEVAPGMTLKDVTKDINYNIDEDIVFGALDLIKNIKK